MPVVNITQASIELTPRQVASIAEIAERPRTFKVTIEETNLGDTVAVKQHTTAGSQTIDLVAPNGGVSRLGGR